MKKLLTSVCISLTLMSSAQITFSLASGSPISSSGNVKCILSKDLNNDGKKDLLSSDAYGTAVSAYLGNGGGQFTANSTFTAPGSGPIFMTVADFNGDSKQDMAVANYYSNNVSIFMGSGAGAFTAAANASYAIGNQPYCVDAADFNMDGRLDIIACSANGYNVSIWFGNGAGSFTSAPSFPISTPAAPYFVCAGFFNQDAFPDFAYVSGVNNTLHVFLNNGSGAFTAAPGSPYASGTEPRTIAAKDLNNDGFTDLVIPNASSNNINIFMGSANGSFTQAAGSPISLGVYCYQAAIADYDMNGTQDIAVTCANSNQLYLLSGNGTGAFTSASLPLSVGNMPQSLVTDDFNGDNKPDLAVADWLGSSINIFLNTSTACAVSAGFTHTVLPGGQVNFQSNSTGASSGATFSWNFGDNTNGSGTSTTHNYSSGTYTVTLTIIDTPGCTSSVTHVLTLEVVTGISEPTVQNGIFICPNPASTILNIEVPDFGNVEKNNFVLYSVTGAQVMNVELNKVKTSVNISQLSAGVYYYKITHGGNGVKQGKLLVEK